MFSPPLSRVFIGTSDDAHCSGNGVQECGKLRKRVDTPGIFRLVDARIRADPERLPADGRNGHQIIEGMVSNADQGFGPRQQRGIEGLQARDHTVGLVRTAADLAERSGKAYGE